MIARDTVHPDPPKVKNSDCFRSLSASIADGAGSVLGGSDRARVIPHAE